MNKLLSNTTHDNTIQATVHLLQQPRLALICEGSSVRALGQQVLVSVFEGLGVL